MDRQNTGNEKSIQNEKQDSKRHLNGLVMTSQKDNEQILHTKHKTYNVLHTYTN